MKNRIARIFVLAIPAMMLVVSCNEENQVGNLSIPKSAVAFVVGGDETSTKSVSSSSVCSTINTIELLEESEIKNLVLTETVSDIDDYYALSEAETKGTPIYTENFDGVIGGFTGVAYIPNTSGNAYSDSDIQGDKDATFSKIEDRTYYHDYESRLTWPSDNELLFFLKANQPDLKYFGEGGVKYYAPSSDAELGSIHYSYNVPGGSDKDAELQPDILFTSQLVKKNTEKNRILFYHSLTAVKFQNGNVADGKQQIVIKKVVLNGIKGSGDCVIKPNYESGKNTSEGNPSNAKSAPDHISKSAQCSKWSNLGEPASSFTQTFDGTLVNEYAGNGEVPESFNTAPNGDNTSLNNLNKSDFSQTFMMIPQVLTDKATVTVYYTFVTGDDDNPNDKVYKSTASLKGLEWKAGEIHTYTLAINGIHVEISDKVNKETNVKSDIVTKNTGNTIAYLRCALASNWVYDDPDTKDINENVLVAANDALFTGKFIADGNKPGLNNGWIIGSDGHVYYANPILPGHTTKIPMFTSYNAPAKTPYQDSHLEIIIALQGVPFDDDKASVKKAWNVDKIYVMEPTFDGGVITALTKTSTTIHDKLTETKE